MGKLRKVSHKDVPLVSSFESADSIHEPFVPNDYAEDGSYPLSTELSCDEGPFDKALFKFYINQKVKSLKRKLTSAGRRNRQKRYIDYPTCSTFTRYSGKFFSGVVDEMCPRYKDVILAYGMGCLLNFVSTEVPLRLVKWLASRFDVLASEFQSKKKFIPVTKYDIHNILDLPVDGERLFCDPESGRDFVLSHFNLSSIPPVSFFANKLKSSEVELSDDDIFICFMIVAFSSFLCPNSSLSPTPKYLHIFKDCHSVCKLDLSQFVYEWLLSSIKKFKDSSKVASKRSVTFGGCHYAFAVSYLDHLNFGLHSVPDVKPRLLAWRGNKVKQFAELDRNNSRSYGKRPLKPFCPSVHLQESVDKSTTSKDVELHPPNGLFAVTVQNSFGPRFGLETAQELIELVQDRNKDKPKIFIDWSESLIIDVLECLSRCPLHANTGPTTKVSGSEDNSQNKFSFGNKSVSIQSVIHERTRAKIDDIPSNEFHVEFQNVDQATPPAAGVVTDGDIQNPVLIYSATTPPKTVVNQDAVPSFPIFGEANAEAGTSMHMFLAKAISSHGICPSSTDCGIPVFDSSLLESAGPFKKCEEKSHVCDFQIPSVTALNHSIGIDDVKHAMKDARYFRPLSPLVPIRLSHLLQNELGDVECSQYVAEKFKKSMETPAVEDCVYTVTLPDPEISKSANSSRRCTVDHCSPIVSKETSNVSSKVNQPEDDVQIVGTSSFVVRCQDLSTSLDATYNKMKNFSSSASMSHNAKKPQAASSPEVEFVSERVAYPSMVAPKAPASNAPTATFIFLSGSAASSSGTHATRRIFYPGRYSSEPYVAPQVNRFVPTQLERHHYLAMTEIGKHEIWCKFEAIRYDKAYCSYRSLATLKSREHVDNFLILCVCRFLFIQSHPSVSKKHFFFSYIGENILDGSNPAIVANAFAGANRAFPMWRSDCLFFPIGRDNHWFSFVVCLKEKKFAFLVSFYDANSYFHTSIHDDLVNNFVNLWDHFVTPIMRKRIVFESFDYVYPDVPQQNNSDDCGVFTSMDLNHWSPRSPIGNMFGAADIDNIRVKLANELFFSTNNTADKTLVTNFSGDA